ncbi:UDP-N-acetylmuramoyl-L-alanyl-D-glutamate--2,6-diaminopimelate ligase [Pseudoflavonifractor phocaeensis]|uniref:UDP-N-acetylmuramoyl-L-alanyl-D-glutamate--2, 6-diaminopimelate ligase n=1 Tax=Pseudoflavonifractor phocaeensis TaxID=1870988 RepID=UPI001F3E097E|nr:UDP-N-acetylmuramoyl-L-alanyl-D-glutamate--2,6-diaminopimelate ligase [Pseudoflavonifractor phocaeensis]MCF2662173.1 UDP-N-acetylmuramoyl-L-alanyl-D-glutamate--2,6-diaminopimelate ligase [Pseudoflavonifractor phocaeensis]
MKLRDLLAGVPLRGEHPDLDMEISSISHDTRTLVPGALFVAMPGDKTDGHRYIRQALDRGAAAVLCQTPPGGPGPWLVTEDSRLALALVSANWFGRPGDGMTLIAVTGTNGKTTTSSLIKEMLEGTLGTKVGLVGTNRNMVGQMELPAHRTTPESYELQALLRRMADEGCTHVVMEASSHALVQHRTAGLTFDVGVFTNLTQDHLDYHRTMEEYRAAKGRLFRQCRRAVLNLDDEAGRWYLDRLPCPGFTYSENRAQADLTARNIRLFPSHVEFEAVTLGHISRVHLPIPGGFSIYNALAALSAGLCLELDLASMAAVLRSVHGVKGRVEIVPVPRAYTVLIDYAHSPNALENILMTARDFTAGRLICLFGCGGDRDRTKRPIMGSVVQELADLAVVTSDNPRSEEPEAIIADILTGMTPDPERVHVEPDRARAIGWALAQGRPGDVIVLAGKGHETYQEIRGVQYPMDEREIVKKWFETAPERQERTGNIPAGIV